MSQIKLFRNEIYVDGVGRYYGAFHAKMFKNRKFMQPSVNSDSSKDTNNLNMLVILLLSSMKVKISRFRFINKHTSISGSVVKPLRTWFYPTKEQLIIELQYI